MTLSPDKREKQKRYLNQRYHRRRKHLSRWKVRLGCAECGYNEHPAALDFDHINPADKRFTIPWNINRNLKSLMTEVRKCRVICANCHRIHSRTQFEQGLTPQKKHNPNNGIQI